MTNVQESVPLSPRPLMSRRISPVELSSANLRSISFLFVGRVRARLKGVSVFLKRKENRVLRFFAQLISHGEKMFRGKNDKFTNFSRVGENPRSLDLNEKIDDLLLLLLL